jgi:hypothetical protein
VTASLTTTTADHGHVLAVATDCLAAFASGVARFVGIEFVRGALRVRGLTSFARDFALLASIHGRESTITASTAVALRLVVRVSTHSIALPFAVERIIAAIVIL